MAEFNFASDEVLKVLRKGAEGKGIEYIGSATSHFQSEPISYDKENKPLSPLSDWEFELARNLQKQRSRVRDPQDAKNLPRFFSYKERYLQQSISLGENMFRFSFDFGRLCPEEGKFDTELMTEYVKLMALIKSGGQEPIITLHHFTMPRFLLRINHRNEIVGGGWEHPDVLGHFKFYIQNVVKFLSDKDRLLFILDNEGYDQKTRERFVQEGLIQFFISLNEPTITPLLAYVTGIFPPYRHGKIILAYNIMKKMVKAHDIAREEIKKLGEKLPENRQPKVGIGYAIPFFDGWFGLAAAAINRYCMRMFERDGSFSDFIGIHYYFRTTPSVFFQRRKRDYGEHPSFGDVYPRGILSILREVHAMYPSKEIFITEIGFADTNDHRKPFWLLETIRYIIEAKKEDIPVRVVLLWSLVDNFEWEYGESIRFGLFKEADLGAPLVSNPKGIQSWEVWQAITKAIREPTIQSLADLQVCYLRAKEKYHKYQQQKSYSSYFNLLTLRK